VYDIYEAASFQESAETAGLGDMFTASRAIDAALQTPGVASPDQIMSGMQEAAKLVLRLRGNIDTTKYGLTADDLIDMSLGLRPRSGKSAVEIQESVERSVSEARSFLQQGKGRPFTGFTNDGRPQARSLGGLREET
jgi:hypothetical protein